MGNYFWLRKWAIVCFLFFFVFSLHKISRAETQRIPLAPGWNLFSLQVVPDNDDPAEVFAGLISENKFEAVWGYDAVTGAWCTYQHETNNLINSFLEIALTKIEAQKGYWIKVLDYAELDVQGALSSDPINFQTSWNLIGFSGLFLQSSDAQDIASVFNQKMNNIDQIWRFNSNTGEFEAYDLTTEPQTIDFTELEPGFGYWVRALTPFSLVPQLGLSLEGDIDAPPLSTDDRPFPQPEDEDFNEDGYYDTPQTQDTISFRAKVSSRYLTITNLGDGTLNWQIQENIPWLYFDQDPDLSSVQGITTTETDSVCITISRAGLLPGLYTGSLTLSALEQNSVIQVKMIVPEIDGDYEGCAVVNLINGQPVDIASIDISLSIFRDQEGFLRGIIDAEKTLLFPFDVFLSGCYYEAGTNHFIISGSFHLPSGPDRNNPPFDDFPGPNDTDVNNNGKEDIINPYPFDLTREITLIGDRVEGDIIAGNYFEVLQGALPEPIMMEGVFSFGRESFLPSKKTPFNYDNTEDINLPSLDTVESSIFINDPVLIDFIEVCLDLDHNALSDLIITLISPLGEEVILHDQKPGEDLETIYSDDVPLVRCFNNFDKDAATIPAEALIAFQGDMAQGEWKLRIQDIVEGVDGKLKEWRLHIYGPAVYEMKGKIIDASTGQGLSGASIILTGAPVIHSTVTDEEGNYVFNLLSSSSYQLTVSNPGYQTKQQTQWIQGADVVVPDISLAPIVAGTANLTASPSVGNTPQEVRLLAVLPSGAVQTEDLCFWDFGDGQTYSHSIASSSHPEIIETLHQYTTAGAYTVSLRITDSTQTQEKALLITQEPILIYPVYGQPDPGPYIFQWAFSGGGNEVNEAAADTASFDVDRPPYRTIDRPFPKGEDTDYSANPAIPPNGKYDVYTPDPEEGHTSFRLICNLGAQFSGKSVAGDKRMQIGPAGLL